MGVTVMAGPVTVKMVVPVTPVDGSVAVMVTVPVFAPPVTNPVADTVAIEVSDDDQVTLSVTLPVAPSE